MSSRGLSDNLNPEVINMVAGGCLVGACLSQIAYGRVWYLPVALGCIGGAVWYISKPAKTGSSLYSMQKA